MNMLISDPPSFQSVPFVSIIVPARNEAGYIERCLTSLQHQSYPRQEYEIILVDNGSVDDTIVIGRQYADIVLSVEGVHVSAVRNFGAKTARQNLDSAGFEAHGEMSAPEGMPQSMSHQREWR